MAIFQVKLYFHTSLCLERVHVLTNTTHYLRSFTTAGQQQGTPSAGVISVSSEAITRTRNHRGERMSGKVVKVKLGDNWPYDGVKLQLKGKLTEIERNCIGQSRFIANNFDKLYDEDERLKSNLAATEKLLRKELDAKLKAIQDTLTVRLDFLDGRTWEAGVKLDENKKLRGTLAEHLDRVQNQVGVLDFRMH